MPQAVFAYRLKNFLQNSLSMKVRENASNIFFASTCVLFLSKNYITLTLDFYASIFLQVVFNGLIAIIVLFRRPPVRISFSLFDIIITLVGTFSMSAITASMFLPQNLWLQAIDIFGVLICLWGVITLSRSFGLLPADRGVVTKGPYKFIRHPIYAGYFISMVALLITTPTLTNAVGTLVYVVAEIIRIVREEKILRLNPIYQEYMLKTRWHVLPYVW